MHLAPEPMKLIAELATRHLDVANGYDQAVEIASPQPARMYRELAGEHRYAADELRVLLEAHGQAADSAAGSAQSILYRGMPSVPEVAEGRGPEQFAYVAGLERDILDLYDRLLHELPDGAQPISDTLKRLRRDVAERLTALDDAA